MAWLKSRPYAAACAIFIAITAPLEGACARLFYNAEPWAAAEIDGRARCGRRVRGEARGVRCRKILNGLVGLPWQLATPRSRTWISLWTTIQLTRRRRSRVYYKNST
jgi:hypothetical protein